VVIAPDGGYVDAGGKEKDLITGVIVNRCDPFEDDPGDRSNSGLVEGNSSLVRATNDLLGRGGRQTHHLRAVHRGAAGLRATERDVQSDDFEPASERRSDARAEREPVTQERAVAREGGG